MQGRSPNIERARQVADLFIGKLASAVRISLLDTGTQLSQSGTFLELDVQFLACSWDSLRISN